MRFDEADVIEDRPDAGSLYVSSVLASVFVFFAILIGLSIVSALDSGSIGTALSIFVVGGVYGIFVMMIVALVIVGPIGTSIGLTLVRIAPPGHWHGAASGASTGIILVGLVVALSPTSYRTLDFETLLFAAAFPLIGAIAGWMVQRWYLGWPVRPA